MLFMILEDFQDNTDAVYRRFRERGRLAPDGLRYVNSWVTADLLRCYRVMECDDARLLDQWMDEWMTSAEPAARIVPRDSAR